MLLYVVSTWVIDAVHSEASFQVRLFGFARAGGRFDDFEGTTVTAANPLDSTVNTVIKTASVNTKNKRRDRNFHHDDFLTSSSTPRYLHLAGTPMSGGWCR